MTNDTDNIFFCAYWPFIQSCFLSLLPAIFFFALVVLFVSCKSSLYIGYKSVVNILNMMLSKPLPVFFLLHQLFYLWVLRVIYMFWIQILCQNILNIFPSLCSILNFLMVSLDVLNFDKVLTYLRILFLIFWLRYHCLLQVKDIFLFLLKPSKV